MQTTLNRKESSLTESVIIAGERASALSELPTSWRSIAGGTVNVGMTDPIAYVEMAQLFHYKMSTGDTMELFESELQQDWHSAIRKVYKSLANEALTFYGLDFQKSSYPDFSSIRQDLEVDKADPIKFKVVDLVEELFGEFAYDLPTSFYEVYLSPIYSDKITDPRYLRFEPESKQNARKWDAILHVTGAVYAIHMVLQSTASRYGLTYMHDRGCNKPMQYIQTTGRFDARMPENRQEPMFAFFWLMLYEYATYPLTPITRR